MFTLLHLLYIVSPPTTNSEPIPTPPSPEANPAEDETDDDEE